MDFDARIGERFDVRGVSAHWECHAGSEWTTRLRRARGEPDIGSDHHHALDGPAVTNAIIENVSVSGAGVLAPADQRSVIDTNVTVTLGPDATFDATICRILPSDEVGWAYFGVEFTTMSDAFRHWLDQVIESHRATQRS